MPTAVQPGEAINSASSSWGLVDILIAGAWFGLVTGFVEGAALRAVKGLSWALGERIGSAEILWVAPIFDLLLFGSLALAMFGVARILGRQKMLMAAAFVFAWLMFMDWLMLTGRLRHSAVLVLGAGLAAVCSRWLRKHQARAVGFWRRTLPWLAALAIFTLVVIQGGKWFEERRAVAKLARAPAGAPNVLVIVVDTLRSDHLSTYGYARPTSPHLDRIAQQGVLFENAFAASSWTLPSHASLLTSRYPHEHGAESGQEPLDDRYPTLAEALRARGYRTGGFSGNVFWFCQANHLDRGFLHFEDYFQSLADIVARPLYARKLDFFVLSRLGYEDEPARRRATDMTNHALRWIDRDRRHPFFVFVNYYDVHDPYLPPQPYRSRFSKLKNPGGIFNEFRVPTLPHLTPEQLQNEIDAYDGAITYVDHEVGRLLSELDKRGFGRNTLVVITSDHGESLGEHGLLGHKNALYRDEIQVPLIFWWPGHLPAGTRVERPVSNTELAATLMDLLGQADQQQFQGPSLAGLWKSPGTEANWPLVLSELAQMPFDWVKINPAYSGWLKSLVGPQWHYILHEKNGPALYDWGKDPRESDNFAGTAEGQRKISDFAARLQLILQPPQRAAAGR